MLFDLLLTNMSRAALVAFVCATIVAPHKFLAEERLRIELLPVEVHMVSMIDGGAVNTPPNPSSLNSTMQTVHEALALLGVSPTHYDLVLSDLEPIVLWCTMATQDLRDRHSCASAQLDDVFDDMSEFMIRLGFVRNTPEYKGAALLGVLVLPEGFYWAHSTYGTNQWWSWVGFEPEDMHWSQTSCSIWSVPWLHVVAHELGHCFGLWHLTDDWNYDSDDRIDLMASHSEGSNLTVNWLKPSNVKRVQQHFRPMSEVESSISDRVIPVKGQTLH